MDTHPLRPLTSTWLAKIKLGLIKKRDTFQIDADYAMKFFSGPYDFLYNQDGAKANKYFQITDTEEFKAPGFKMTHNRVAELVQIFGPALYHRNPVRTVNPRKPPMMPPQLFGDPNNPFVQQQYQQMMQQEGQARTVDEARATLLSTYLNYTPTALDLKTESRWSIDEAIIKGMGILWTELYTPAGSQMKMVGSFFGTVDDLVIDPDVESLRDAKWIAKRCTHPHWEVEDEYGLPRDSLKKAAGAESSTSQAAVLVDPDGVTARKRGDTNDLVTYWKIWSKQGMGGQLKGLIENLRAPLETYGNYCYMVVCHDVPYLLNLPDEKLAVATDDEVKQAVQWPTPFWADDSWPFTPIAFHWVPRQVWPMSHMKPAMGELMFLNWAYSLLASKVRIACRDFIAIAKSSAQELKDMIKSGADYTIIEIEALHGSIDKVVQFLQHPGFNPEIKNTIEMVKEAFEQRTGLTELAYGLSGTQMRSAKEADVKGAQISVRPDDMANRVEDAMAEVARKEALAARWHLTGQDVQPVVGQMGAYFWDMMVTASDPTEIIHSLEYRIEAGSARKPNRDKEVADMTQAMQNLFPMWMEYAKGTGNVNPVNALVSQWAKANEWDATPFLLPPMMPPAPEPQPAQRPSGPAQRAPTPQGNGARVRMPM